MIPECVATTSGSRLTHAPCSPSSSHKGSPRHSLKAPSSSRLQAPICPLNSRKVRIACVKGKQQQTALIDWTMLRPLISEDLSSAL